ncbi:UNVERIFIED_ORG: hypothetical protein B2H93_04785 [Clostridium botulinum]
MKRIAKRTNKTLNYTQGKEYATYISQQCNSILFLENDLGDNVVINKIDFAKKDSVDIVVVKKINKKNDIIEILIDKHFDDIDKARMYCEYMNMNCSYPIYSVEIYELQK